ncbi:MAG: hypothetical protein V4724_20590 [Pseudomonadota bacterium]
MAITYTMRVKQAIFTRINRGVIPLKNSRAMQVFCCYAATFINDSAEKLTLHQK